MRITLKRKLKRLADFPADFFIEYKYSQTLKLAKRMILEQPEFDKAIILHLYYQEMWPYFSKKISTLMKTGEYALIVTLPLRGKAAENIIKDYPNAFVFNIPNKGRDVLSFIKIAKLLYTHGYRYVLKIHSKKSPQRVDGLDWSDRMITDLTPSSVEQIESVETIMNNNRAAVIGPSENYVPLTTYYNDNQPKVFWILSKTLSNDAAVYINSNNFDYGFFAGTMMWIRLDSIEPLFKMRIWSNNFPSESAQLDGTIAHAIERVICVIPEYNERSIYQMNQSGIEKITYKTDYIPDWSDYYHVKEDGQ